MTTDVFSPLSAVELDGRVPRSPLNYGGLIDPIADKLVAGARAAGWPVPGVEEADVDVVPLHVDAAADPAGRRRVVGRGDLDATVQMHGAAAVLVVAERLERQRAERRTFLGKHGGDLALGRAVHAGVGPAPLPAVQVRLAVVEVLEAEAAQRRLRVRAKITS